jgi:hypothetical protein
VNKPTTLEVWFRSTVAALDRGLELDYSGGAGSDHGEGRRREGTTDSRRALDVRRSYDTATADLTAGAVKDGVEVARGKQEYLSKLLNFDGSGSGGCRSGSHPRQRLCRCLQAKVT